MIDISQDDSEKDEEDSWWRGSCGISMLQDLREVRRSAVVDRWFH